MSVLMTNPGGMTASVVSPDVVATRLNEPRSVALVHDSRFASDGSWVGGYLRSRARSGAGGRPTRRLYFQPTVIYRTPEHAVIVRRRAWYRIDASQVLEFAPYRLQRTPALLPDFATHRVAMRHELNATAARFSRYEALPGGPSHLLRLYMLGGEEYLSWLSPPPLYKQAHWFDTVTEIPAVLPNVAGLYSMTHGALRIGRTPIASRASIVLYVLPDQPLRFEPGGRVALGIWVAALRWWRAVVDSVSPGTPPPDGTLYTDPRISGQVCVFSTTREGSHHRLVISDQYGLQLGWAYGPYADLAELLLALEMACGCPVSAVNGNLVSRYWLRPYFGPGDPDADTLVVAAASSPAESLPVPKPAERCRRVVLVGRQAGRRGLDEPGAD